MKCNSISIKLHFKGKKVIQRCWKYQYETVSRQLYAGQAPAVHMVLWTSTVVDVAHVGLLVGGDLLAKPIDLRQKEHMVKQFNYVFLFFSQ